MPINRRIAVPVIIAAFALALWTVGTPRAEDKFIIVQSTTSTQNSGLFEHILPIFTKKTGIDVRVVVGRHRSGFEECAERRRRRRAGALETLTKLLEGNTSQ